MPPGPDQKANSLLNNGPDSSSSANHPSLDTLAIDRTTTTVEIDLPKNSNAGTRIEPTKTVEIRPSHNLSSDLAATHFGPKTRLENKSNLNSAKTTTIARSRSLNNSARKSGPDTAGAKLRSTPRSGGTILDRIISAIAWLFKQLERIILMQWISKSLNFLKINKPNAKPETDPQTSKEGAKKEKDKILSAQQIKRS